jgi:hypothetical protein
VSDIVTDVSAAGADPVMSAIQGARDADAVLLDVRLGCAPPDAVHEAIVSLPAGGDPDRLRAFARRLQKRLENAR